MRKYCETHEGWHGHLRECKRCKADYMAEFRESKRTTAPRLQLGRPRKEFDYSGWPDDKLALEYRRAMAATRLSQDRAEEMAAEMFNRGGG